MDEVVNRLATYLALARVAAGRARPFVSDRLLLTAAAIATRQLLPRTAAACRNLILRHNPQHAVGKWQTMEQALRDADFAPLLKRAEQQYPPEQMEFLLGKLEIDIGGERHDCGRDRKFLAALLQVEPVELDECLD